MDVFTSLKRLKVNIPLVEALKGIPRYSRHSEDLMKNKPNIEDGAKEKMNERCFAWLENTLPSKEKDSGSFTLPESIDSGFSRFNTIITSLKALDEVFSCKNYVREFLGALHPKWRVKVTTIKELKDLSSLALDELIAKKEASDDETSTSGSDDKEYVIAVRNFKKFFRRKGRFVHQPGEEKKSSRQRDDKKNMRIENILDVVTLDSSYFSDNASSLDDDSMKIEYINLCEISLKIINSNKILKTKRELLEKEILELNEKIKKHERNEEVDIGCESCQQLRLENAKIKETQVKIVKFDQSANSLNDMLNVQRPPSNKVGLGFDKNKCQQAGQSK
ncbi:hypothetical protein Tco_0772369 [Tanacetum coccineum]|uniref:UBN2 domain-containing protein n=1 Tax=Tanacetum coccineum TaxID=301880 RepID=A0ABQ4ZLI7_9ASTR